MPKVIDLTFLDILSNSRRDICLDGTDPSWHGLDGKSGDEDSYRRSMTQANEERYRSMKTRTAIATWEKLISTADTPERAQDVMELYRGPQVTPLECRPF